MRALADAIGRRLGRKGTRAGGYRGASAHNAAYGAAYNTSYATAYSAAERSSGRGASNRSAPSGARQRVVFGASPLLSVPLPTWRSRLALAVLFLAFAALVLRAFTLQGGVRTDFLQRQGEARYARTLEMPATRGKLTDRQGAVLAASVPARAIWAIPEDVAANGTQLAALARLLDLRVSELKAKLAVDRSFVYLRRQVDLDVVERIKALKIAGIHNSPEYKRHYPEGAIAAHVVGFTNVEDRGQEGVERAFEKQLAGRIGSRRVIKDRLGRVVEDDWLRAPVDGRDVALSIDSRIQHIAASALRAAVEKNQARGGSAVVLDVHTGELLALVNYPSFDPNQRERLSGDAIRNRALTDTFEPGSTLKPFAIATALEAGQITPSTTIQTAPGRMTIGGRSIGDTHPHGPLTVAQVVAKSSNVGTAKIALELPARSLWETYTNAGLGRVPEEVGVLPAATPSAVVASAASAAAAPAAMTTTTSATHASSAAGTAAVLSAVPTAFSGAVAGRLRPYATWRPIEQATIAYGYGVSVSLLQLARAYTVFARDGDIVPVSLVRSDVPAQGRPVMSAQTARAMREMLELATSDEGTAPAARTLGYRVAGKTGTARKIRDGQYVNAYVASFAGFAPASAPRLVIAVMVDEPDFKREGGRYYGGDVAAPVFSQIAGQALRLLRVAPDEMAAPVKGTERPKNEPATSIQLVQNTSRRIP